MVGEAKEELPGLAPDEVPDEVPKQHFRHAFGPRHAQLCQDPGVSDRAERGGGERESRKELHLALAASSWPANKDKGW